MARTDDARLRSGGRLAALTALVVVTAACGRPPTPIDSASSTATTISAGTTTTVTAGPAPNGSQVGSGQAGSPKPPEAGGNPIGNNGGQAEAKGSPITIPAFAPRQSAYDDAGARQGVQDWVDDVLCRGHGAQCVTWKPSIVEEEGEEPCAMFDISPREGATIYTGKVLTVRVAAPCSKDGSDTTPPDPEGQQGQGQQGGQGGQGQQGPANPPPPNGP